MAKQTTTGKSAARPADSLAAAATGTTNEPASDEQAQGELDRTALGVAGDADDDAGGVASAEAVAAAQAAAAADALAVADALAAGLAAQAAVDAAARDVAQAITAAGKTKYRVISPLRHNGVRYAVGKAVELTPLQAAPLLPHTIKAKD